MSIYKRTCTLSATALCVLLASCSSDDDDMVVDDIVPEGQTEAFALDFAATDGTSIVTCGDVIENLGVGGQNSIEIGDMRFFVGELELLDADGETIEYTLDENDFQYTGTAGRVSLIDLTDNSAGACLEGNPAAAGSTTRTNSQVTGMATSSDIAAVRFSVGVPQALMKATINENTAEGAPSPLNELYWSWASGYRHFVVNFSAAHSDGSTGEGALHIGSTGCTAADGENALESLDVCEYINTPAVELTGLTSDSVIAVDVSAAIADVDFMIPVRDPDTFEPVIDENGAEVMTTGVSCHSSSAQTDCPQIFSNLGMNIEDGSSDASSNSVFSLR